MASSPDPTEWSEAETPGAGDLDGTLSVSGAFFCSAAIEEILAAVAASIQKNNDSGNASFGRTAAGAGAKLRLKFLKSVLEQ
jgi:hypothetical protein